jgi:hypothetical protein
MKKEGDIEVVGKRQEIRKREGNEQVKGGKVRRTKISE